uniref:Uncharacterized protein n=1 Tax=viral metagenome TaxID=1070528 RepID=A0A6C0JAQ3_9ZZZZ
MFMCLLLFCRNKTPHCFFNCIDDILYIYYKIYL